MTDTSHPIDSPIPEDDSDELSEGIVGHADEEHAGAANEGGIGGVGGENEKQHQGAEQSEGSSGAENAPSKKFIDNRFAIFFYERICQTRPPATKREFAQVYSNFVRSVSASELRAHGKAIAPMQCLWQLTRLGHVKVLRDGELQWVVPRSPSPGNVTGASDINNSIPSPSVTFASPLSTASSPMSPFPAFSFSPSVLPSPSPRRKPLDGAPAPSPRKKDAPTPPPSRPVRSGGGQRYAGLQIFLERVLGEQEAEKYTTILVQNEVDWTTLHMLGKQELIDLGFSVGARIKIANAINQNLETYGGVPPIPGSREDQQRQIDQLTQQVQSLQIQLAQRSPKPDISPHAHTPHSQPPLHPQMSPRSQMPPTVPTPQTLATLTALAGFAVRDVLLALIAAAENAQLSLAALHMQFQGRTGLHLTAAVEALGFSNIVIFLRTVPHVVVLGNAVKLAQPGPLSARTRLEKSWRRATDVKEGENSPSDDESDLLSGDSRHPRAPQSASSSVSRPSPAASPSGRRYVLQEVG